MGHLHENQRIDGSELRRLDPSWQRGARDSVLRRGLQLPQEARPLQVARAAHSAGAARTRRRQRRRRLPDGCRRRRRRRGVRRRCEPVLRRLPPERGRRRLWRRRRDDRGAGWRAFGARRGEEGGMVESVQPSVPGRRHRPRWLVPPTCRERRDRRAGERRPAHSIDPLREAVAGARAAFGARFHLRAAHGRAADPLRATGHDGPRRGCDHPDLRPDVGQCLANPLRLRVRG
mmetsp:Transcript_3420/g.9814  ORF Transcript_3420/g.9814 Transcript_3420/m.9814 type:complete len:232 (+) Transcript_3420:2127-2822(+)